MDLQFCSCPEKRVGCQVCPTKSQNREKRGYMKIKPL